MLARANTWNGAQRRTYLDSVRAFRGDACFVLRSQLRGIETSPSVGRFVYARVDYVRVHFPYSQFESSALFYAVAYYNEYRIQYRHACGVVCNAFVRVRAWREPRIYLQIPYKKRKNNARK